MADAVEVTTDLRETIAAELEAARARTLALLAPLSDDELARQHSPIMSPLVWDLAHIGHFEELWLLRHLTGAAPMLPEKEGLYDAFEHGRGERARLALLEPATARSFLGDVRGRVHEVLESIELDPADRLLRDGFVFGLVVQHEAASWDPEGRKLRYPSGDEAPTGGEANLGGRRFAPAPAGAFRGGASPSGVLQTVGDVWERTSSHFTGYPGFQSFPYREYSEVFFGSDYRVLRGGSWGTHRTAIRTTFRNWDLPIRRQLFAGFRCARDAG